VFLVGHQLLLVERADENLCRKIAVEHLFDDLADVQWVEQLQLAVQDLNL
jgi:hypothetical protein